ncbi:HER237Wp [Eremothecium sinecaudum]|uniref:HER237Wp n=1 Tax=Eremothecium sinecaudum TaxID=45286 RepID=A0A0X8HU86_9SACH|nr:HER237Wp [Eremothecium sinecaudum]AMD21515.1 HER237Wp [Eremothecium sinecaudum]
MSTNNIVKGGKKEETSPNTKCGSGNAVGSVDDKNNNVMGSGRLPVVRRHRAKTFTGCWTCRLRKVKCDLGKPTCKRCEKSRLDCGGYDIKLRWSNPIQFDKFGNQVAADTDKEGSEPQQQFQRRNITFVRYKDEYEYYEDMDDELSALHSPPLDMIANDNTWIIKKFGVFKGTDQGKNKYVPRKKKKANRILVDAVAREKRKRQEQIEKQELRRKRKQKQANQMASGAFSASLRQVASGATNASSAPFDFDISNIGIASHEWISGELKDEAVLSGITLHNTGNSIPGTHASGSIGPGRMSGGMLNAHHLCDNNRNGNISSQSAPVLYPQTLNRDDKLRAAISVNKNVQPANDITLGTGESRMPREVMELVHSEIASTTLAKLHHNLPLQISSSALKINGLMRFLMRHYSQNVVEVMSLVSLPSNPWITIYLPRALNAMGELAAIGHTSNSRNTILNAILALSCFDLRNKFPSKSDEAKYFLNLNCQFMNQALSFLKLCLDLTIKDEKYKDVLAAILVVVSVEIRCGSTMDFQRYLNICEWYIHDRMKLRPLCSPKARYLHRIFALLKLIQSSTAIDKVSDKELNSEVRNSGGSTMMSDLLTRNSKNEKTGACETFFSKDGISIEISPVERIVLESAECGTTLQLINEELLKDAFYGLPVSIVLLFADCIELIRKKNYFRNKGLSISSDFEKSFLVLEKRLQNWEPEWNFWKDDRKLEFINELSEGIYHHTMSFYNGLIIYYYSMGRDFNINSLQSYVLKVLNHLTPLDKIINVKQSRINPLAWQSLIAGCACTDTNMQFAFKTWMTQFANGGVGPYYGALQVMLEVWRRRLNYEDNDDWYSVYSDWGMNMILC